MVRSSKRRNAAGRFCSESFNEIHPDILFDGRQQYAVLIEDLEQNGIVHRGGAVLGTERAPEMTEPEGQRRAAGNLEVVGVEALVVIGGNGRLAGGMGLGERGVGVVGLPATIDNDVWGTDTAIGVDTALDTAL